MPDDLLAKNFTRATIPGPNPTTVAQAHAGFYNLHAAALAGCPELRQRTRRCVSDNDATCRRGTIRRSLVYESPFHKTVRVWCDYRETRVGNPLRVRGSVSYHALGRPRYTASRSSCESAPCYHGSSSR